MNKLIKLELARKQEPYLTTLFSIEACTFQNKTDINSSKGSFKELSTSVYSFDHTFMVLIEDNNLLTDKTMQTYKQGIRYQAIGHDKQVA